MSQTKAPRASASQGDAPQQDAPQRPAEPPLPTDMGGILRLGLLNYVMRRWAPRNPIVRLAVEMALLILFFGILALLYLASRG